MLAEALSSFLGGDAGAKKACLTLFETGSTGVLDSASASKPVSLQFNPTDLTIKKPQSWKETEVQGIDGQPMQWLHGGPRVLSFDTLFDSSGDGSDVQLADAFQLLRKAADLAPKAHRPPVVQFEWGRVLREKTSEAFRGVLDGLTTTFVLFAEDGTPLRAKVSVALKEFKGEQDIEKAAPTQSPDLDRVYVARRGDSLQTIAWQVYGDPGLWRVLADANGRRGPTDVPPGFRVRLPRLR